MDKKSIRKECLKRRDALTVTERDVAHKKLLEILKEKQVYQQSKIILLFASCRSEIDTMGILKQALSSKKQVFFPKVAGKEMVFYEITDVGQLMPGFQGILEPVGDTLQFQTDMCKDACMIMPGVAFDKAGNRLGYGGGFYDRFLEKHPALCQRSIAIGYSCQLVNQIETEAFDIKPNDIVLV